MFSFSAAIRECCLCLTRSSLILRLLIVILSKTVKNILIKDRINASYSLVTSWDETGRLIYNCRKWTLWIFAARKFQMSWKLSLVLKAIVTGWAELSSSNNLDQKWKHSCSQEWKRLYKPKYNNAGVLLSDWSSVMACRTNWASENWRICATLEKDFMLCRMTEKIH